eukprot:TRINITY_DN3998_c0_g2_i1.p1 TRINITY_DN3998_c0_g2~~TRINITY_DN3998_c0_g2_i1.p1  ORF type:complete len:155 (-),score=31.81 TRINITY_DN3998_c0_g2_i1:90-554(-)
MALQVEEKTLGPQGFLSLRKKDVSFHDLQGLISNTYITVLEIIKEQQGVEVTGKVCHLLHSLAEDTVDVEILVPVSQKANGKDNLQYTELPGGKVASTVVKGPYDNVFATYHSLREWASSQGKTPAGPLKTIFLKSPLDTHDENSWETEIQIPI